MTEILDLSLPIKFFSKDIPSEISQNQVLCTTSDINPLSIIFSILICLTICSVGLLVVRYMKNYSFVSGARYNGSHINSSILHQKNNNQNRQLIALVSILTFILMVASTICINVAYASNSIIVTNTSQVNAYIDTETGEVAIDNAIIKNDDNRNIEIVSSAVTVNDEFASLVNCDNITFKMNCDQDLLFNGNPGPDFYDLENPFLILQDESKELNLSMNNVNPLDNLKLIDSDAIYIKFKIAVKQYQVSFDANGGEGEYDTVIVEDGKTVSKPTNDPVKYGYTFDGWCSDPQGEQIFDFNSPIKSNLTLYAFYSPRNDIEVIFDYNFEGAPDAETVFQTFGQKYLFPNREDPWHEGYTLKNWNTEIDGSGDTIDSTSVVDSIESQILYAQWVTEMQSVSLVADVDNVYPGEESTIPYFVDQDNMVIDRINVDLGTTPTWIDDLDDDGYPCAVLTYSENNNIKNVYTVNNGRFAFDGQWDVDKVTKSTDSFTAYFDKFLNRYTVSELRAISSDLSTPGSVYYDEFQGYVDNAFSKKVLGTDGTDIPADNGNTDITNVEDKKNHVVLDDRIYRIIGINHDVSNGEAGLTFMSTSCLADPSLFDGSGSHIKDYSVSTVATILESTNKDFMAQVTKKYVYESLEGVVDRSVSCKQFILSYKEFTGDSSFNLGGTDYNWYAGEGNKYSAFAKYINSDDEPAIAGIAGIAGNCRKSTGPSIRAWTRSPWPAGGGMFCVKHNECIYSNISPSDSAQYILPCFCMGAA